jgi:hypothetical protein
VNFCGEEIFKDETVGRQTCGHKRRNMGRRARNREDRQIRAQGLPHKIECRIGYAWGACVAYERKGFVVGEPFDKPGRYALLVEVVIGQDRGRDVIVVKQFARHSGIFGKNQIRLPENGHRAICNIG